jgi:hypothetical protein
MPKRPIPWGHNQRLVAWCAESLEFPSPGGQVALPPAKGLDGAPQRRQVRAVLTRCVGLVDAPYVTGREGRRCVIDLFAPKVPQPSVEAALALAEGGRLNRAACGRPLGRRRALHYPRPVVEELLETPAAVGLGYLEHLLRHLRAFAEPKIARLRAATQPPTDV